MIYIVFSIVQYFLFYPFLVFCVFRGVVPHSAHVSFPLAIDSASALAYNTALDSAPAPRDGPATRCSGSQSRGIIRGGVAGLF